MGTSREKGPEVPASRATSKRAPLDSEPSLDVEEVGLELPLAQRTGTASSSASLLDLADSPGQEESSAPASRRFSVSGMVMSQLNAKKAHRARGSDARKDSVRSLEKHLKHDRPSDRPRQGSAEEDGLVDSAVVRPATVSKGKSQRGDDQQQELRRLDRVMSAQSHSGHSLPGAVDDQGHGET